ELRYLLAKANVDCEPVLTDPTRPTTVKTRIIAHDQHVVRIDEEDTTPVAPRIAAEIASRAEEAMENSDAVLISDYAKGAMTPEVLRRIIQAAKQSGKPVVVDPKGHDWSIYAGATVIKPNRGELAALTGLAVRNHADAISAARRLMAAMGSTAVVVTEGKEGMTFLAPDGPERTFPAYARQVYDVTGAGDTVSATLTLALASGATLEEAVWLSNVAASLAVAEVGTVAVSRERLAAAVELAPDPA
ncbi:MAG: PfkB family carbohydrate kinase, partial [Bryobacteraceae bacterium]